MDWRDGIAEIVAAVASFLPEGYLELEHPGDAVCQLIVRGKPPKSVSLSPQVKQEELLVSISEALKPDFELRQFRPVDGDGYAIFVAPHATWSAMERNHPQSIDRLFLTAERLAAYWRKGYFACFFIKP